MVMLHYQITIHCTEQVLIFTGKIMDNALTVFLNSYLCSVKNCHQYYFD